MPSAQQWQCGAFASPSPSPAVLYPSCHACLGGHLHKACPLSVCLSCASFTCTFSFYLFLFEPLKGTHWHANTRPHTLAYSHTRWAYVASDVCLIWRSVIIKWLSPQPHCCSCWCCTASRRVRDAAWIIHLIKNSSCTHSWQVNRHSECKGTVQ